MSYVSASYKSVNVQIPIDSPPDQKNGSNKSRNTLQSLISKTRDEFSVEIMSSVDLSTSTLSVFIRGPSNNVDNAKSQLLRKTASTVTLYLFATASLLPYIFRKPAYPYEDSDVNIIAYGNGDFISSFSFYKSGAINESDFLTKIDHPAFAPPKSPFEKKVLFIFKGTRENIESRWNHIYKLCEEVLPNKFVQIDVDRSLIPLLALDHSPDYIPFSQLIGSHKSIVTFIKTPITISLPPLFPPTTQYSSKLSLYGPSAVVDVALKSLNKSISDLLKSTQTYQISLDKKLHRIVSGNDCSNIHYLLKSAGVSICFPPYTDDTNSVTVRAGSLRDLENAKITINNLISSNRSQLYDINLKSLDFSKDPLTFEYVFDFLKFCKTAKIDAFERKHNCKLFRFFSGYGSSYWNNLVSIEYTNPSNSGKVLSELADLVKSSLTDVLLLPINFPTLFISTFLRNNPSSSDSQFLSPSQLFKNDPPPAFLGIIIPDQSKYSINNITNSSFSSTLSENTYRSHDFSSKVCVVMKHPNAHKLSVLPEKDKILHDRSVSSLLCRLFDALKSNEFFEILFYVIPPAISAKYYPKIMSSSVIPLLVACSIPYSLEYPGIDDATVDFVFDPQYNKVRLEIPSGPCIAICTDKDHIRIIQSDLEYLFSSWLNLITKQIVSTVVKIPKGFTYLSLFTNSRKKELEVNQILAQAYQSLSISSDYSDLLLYNKNTKITPDLLLSVKKEQFVHEFSVHLLRTHPPPPKSLQQNNTNFSQQDYEGITITGFKETVDTVHDIIKKRIISHGDTSSVTIPVLQKLSESSKKIIENHPSGITILNRVLFGSSSAVRTLLTNARRDSKIKVGFSKRGEFSPDSKISSLPSDAYVFWATGSSAQINSIVDAAFITINDQLFNAFSSQFTVSKLSSNQIIPYYTQEINKIKKDFDVSITTYSNSSPNRGLAAPENNKASDSNPNVVNVKIEGKKKSVDAAKKAFIKLRDKCASFHVRKIYIPYYMRNSLIGKNIDKINKIIEKFGGTPPLVSISLAYDPKNKDYDRKTSYIRDTINVSSFEETFPDVLSNLIDIFATKKHANIVSILKSTISIADFNCVKDLPCELYLSKIILPSGLDHSHYSILSTTFRNYALSLDNVIIRTTILPETIHEDMQFEGYKEFRSDLTEIEDNPFAGNLMKLFTPPVEYTIISKKQSLLPQIESQLKLMSLIYYTYHLDQKWAQYIEFNTNGSKFLPHIDYVTSSISSLENHLHLGFAMLSSSSGHSLRIGFCTLSNWKNKLISTLDEIFENLVILNNINAYVINISDLPIVRDANGKSNGNAAQDKTRHLKQIDARVYGLIKRAIDTDSMNDDISMFNMNYCPEQFADLTSINFYLCSPNDQDTNKINQVIKKTLFQNMDDENFNNSIDTSKYASNITLTQITANLSDFSSSLFGPEIYCTASFDNHDTSQSSDLPVTSSQPNHVSGMQNLIIDLLQFAKNDASVTHIPEVTKESTPVIPIGISAVDYNVMNNDSTSTKGVSPSLVKSQQEVQKPPDSSDKDNNAPTKKPSGVNSSKKAVEAKDSHRHDQSQIRSISAEIPLPQISGVDGFIFKGRNKQSVTLTYKEVEKQPYKLKENNVAYSTRVILENNTTTESPETPHDYAVGGVSCDTDVADEKADEIDGSVSFVDEDIIEDTNDEILEYDTGDEYAGDENIDLVKQSEFERNELNLRLHNDDFIYDYNSLSSYSDDSDVEYLSPRSFLSRSLSSSSRDLVDNVLPEAKQQSLREGDHVSPHRDSNECTVNQNEVKSRNTETLSSSTSQNIPHQNKNLPSELEWKGVGRNVFTNKAEIKKNPAPASQPKIIKTGPKKKGQEKNSFFVNDEEVTKLGSDAVVSQKTSNKNRRKRRAKSKGKAPQKE